MRVGDKMMKKTRKIIAITFVLVAMLVTASGSAIAGWSTMTSGTTDAPKGVWGSSGKDVFAVSNWGNIIHYGSSGWTSMTSVTKDALEGVWGGSGTDVFAVGLYGTILHYDGSGWTSMTSGTTLTLAGVWCSSGKEVFAVGTSGIIIHYDGSSWSSMIPGKSSYDLSGVWGSSGSDVFAVGSSGNILHYDGSGWTSMTSGVTNWLYSVWGSSGSDVFAVGSSGIILHYGGTESTTTTSIVDCPFGSCKSSDECTDIYGAGWACISGCCEKVPVTTTTIGDDDECTIDYILEGDEAQLDAIRDFRDNVLSQTPAGQELIKLYYQWSPVIVQAMKKDAAFKEQVKEMVDGVLELIE